MTSVDGDLLLELRCIKDALGNLKTQANLIYMYIYNKRLFEILKGC